MDVKISDDVERLRITRNKIVHRIKADIDILEMNYHFANLVNVTQRIDAYLGKPANQGFTKELQDFQTFCMDFEMEQKYFQALKDIEDIKEKFAAEQVHFHYGKTFTNFIKEIKTKAQKCERRGISIFLEDVDNNDKRKILNELKSEINSGLVNIEFKQAVSGSLVLNIDILNTDVLTSEKKLGDELYSFLCKTLKLVDLDSCLQTDFNVVLVKEEYDDFEVDITLEEELWNEPIEKYTSVKPSELRLDLGVKKELFSTDDTMQEEIGRLVENIMRTDGNSNHIPVNARLEPGNYAPPSTTVAPLTSSSGDSRSVSSNTESGSTHADETQRDKADPGNAQGNKTYAVDIHSEKNIAVETHSGKVYGVDLQSDKTHADETQGNKVYEADTQSDKTYNNDTQSNKTYAANTQSNSSFANDTQSDKTNADDTQSDKTHADDTQSDKTNADDTQSDKTHADDTQSDKTLAIDTQSDINHSENAKSTAWNTFQEELGTNVLDEDDMIICKVCMDNEVGIVFLPCGHLVCCVECAPVIQNCPMCRTHIRGNVRTYIA